MYLLDFEFEFETKMNLFNLKYIFLIYSLITSSIIAKDNKKNHLQEVLMLEEIASLYCLIFKNLNSFQLRTFNPFRTTEKSKCERILTEIQEIRQAKEVKQREKEREKEDKIYRTHLAPRIKGSFVNDFLTMRYRK